MTVYDLKKFIEELLIPDLKKMIENRLHYYAFSIICQATEVLGSVFDQKDIADFGESENRFTNGLAHFFKDSRYKNQQAKFFEVLRGPLIHQLRPGEGFLLASVEQDQINPENHLKQDETGKTYLIIEQFLTDFCDAFERFKKEIAKRKDLDAKKFAEPFISVCTTNPPVSYARKEKNELLTLYPSATGQVCVTRHGQ